MCSRCSTQRMRDRSRRRQKEISLDYLIEEKCYPLGTTDEYFEAPYEEIPHYDMRLDSYPHQWELAAALLSLPERNREIIFLYFFGDYTQQEIGEMYAIVRAASREPEAVEEVLRHCSKHIRIAAIENGHIDRDTEDSIKSRLVAALFKFHFDEQEV